MRKFNVSSGPVVADYVTADREEELLRVLDAESSNAAVTTADGTLTTFAGGFWPGVVVASRID